LNNVEFVKNECVEKTRTDCQHGTGYVEHDVFFTTLKLHVEIDETVEGGRHFKQPGAEFVDAFHVEVEIYGPDLLGVGAPRWARGTVS
jgi:hypothetical protein